MGSPSILYSLIISLFFFILYNFVSISHFSLQFSVSLISLFFILFYLYCPFFILFLLFSAVFAHYYLSCKPNLDPLKRPFLKQKTCTPCTILNTILFLTYTVAGNISLMHNNILLHLIFSFFLNVSVSVLLFNLRLLQQYDNVYL